MRALAYVLKVCLICDLRVLNFETHVFTLVYIDIVQGWNWLQFSNFHSFIEHLYAIIIRIIVLKNHSETNLTETNNWYRGKHYLWTQIFGKHRRLIVILIEMKLSFLQLSFVIMWENHILYIISVVKPPVIRMYAPRK